MGKYNINHRCGHVVEVQLFGKNQGREYRIGQLEREDCPDCRKAAFNAANAAAAEEIRSSGKASSLPALIGTEKQIAWAETLRARALGEARDAVAQAEERLKGGGKPGADAIEARRRALREIEGKDQARWWIDRRDKGGQSLVEDLAKAVRARMMIAEAEASGFVPPRYHVPLGFIDPETVTVFPAPLTNGRWRLYGFRELPEGEGSMIPIGDTFDDAAAAVAGIEAAAKKQGWRPL